MSEKIELNLEGKKYIIKELTWEEGDLGDTTNLTQQQRNAVFISKCLEEPKLTNEEILKLPYKIGLKLFLECDKLNRVDAQYFTSSQNN